ncbi:MAG: hypothetical protein K1X64_16245 [Myxococcaceae bacterium]|nr:hypothetical protein [Myxococcaceae bacterium]
MRKGLMVLLGLGVVLGYGSTIARAGHYRQGCYERWSQRYDDERARWNAPAAPVVVSAPAAPAVAPSGPLVVAPQAAAPAPAAAPLVIVIPINGQAQAATPLVVPVPSAAINNVPATSASPSAGPQ